MVTKQLNLCDMARLKEGIVHVSNTILKRNKGRIRKVHFVFKGKDSYKKTGIGIWWSTNKGVGIIGKPDRQLKYFMFGMTLFNKLTWLEFTWLGKADGPQRIKMKESGITKTTIV